jgi:hypothetical protein
VYDVPWRKPERSKVFISYSHKDRRWLDRLRVYLRPLERKFEIDVWDDTKIKAGARWRDEINKAIQSARVAILLVSADFLASDFVATDELPPLLKAAEEEGATILPLIIGPCRFSRDENLSRFQAVNDPSKPLRGIIKNKQESFLYDLSLRVEDLLMSKPSAPRKTPARQSLIKKASQGAKPTTPVLAARFSTDQRGRLLLQDGAYEIRLFIKNPPHGTRSVVYTLHKSFDEPVREVNKGVEDFEEYITCYRDFEIDVKINGRHTMKFTTYLSSALEQFYGNRASATVRKAINFFLTN